MFTQHKAFGFFEIFLSIAVLSVIASALIPRIREHIVQQELSQSLSALDLFHVALNQRSSLRTNDAAKDVCAVKLPATNAFEFECRPTENGSGFELIAKSNGFKGMSGYQYTIDADGHRITQAYPNANVPVDCWLAADGSCQL